MELGVKVLDVTALPNYWPMCEPLIASGLAPSDGEANAQHVLADLQAQRATLIVGVDAVDAVVTAMVVQFILYPNYTVAHVVSIGGRGVVDNEVHWTTEKAWMRQRGAVKVQGVCKPAQARLWQKLGFADTYHLVRQAL